MIIRTISHLDVEGVVKLWHLTKKAAYPYLLTEQKRTISEDMALFRENIWPRNDVWVADTGDDLLGFLAMQNTYIDRLYVSPKAQRHGVGSALLRHAKTLSPERLELHTHQKNLPACKFYEKHGFQAVKFGISPAPENEPDVEYHWRP
jgi:ribosomal protein S18 acetylase RimI-like enzyme